jgi:hypothetical protein
VQPKPRASSSFAATEELLIAGHLGSSSGATVPSSCSTTRPRCPLAQPLVPPVTPSAKHRCTPSPSCHRCRESSFGEPLLLDVPQTSPPPHRVALATVPNPPHRWPQPESDQPPPPLLRAPMLPCLRMGRASVDSLRVAHYRWVSGSRWLV